MKARKKQNNLEKKVLTRRYYFNFGGNLVCIDVGLAVLKVIIEKSEIPFERGL
ncbi:transmembrane protein, putative [Medicago truncatula]|uniref:Transmembrane protein, putative n=1 Tax=Medicago truncatula TaxID=3880 RepID=G7KUX2_MEDTR|nr:transmembrane protein, putative [Medicago truncatula]